MQRRTCPTLKPSVANRDRWKGRLYNPEVIVAGDDYHKGKESKFAFGELLQEKGTCL